jgi:ubiquinone/menaquinone biosynthesis C-methylase UbiE
MPLFRRRDERPPSRAAEPTRPPLEDEDTDWRSFDSVGETYGRLFGPNMGLVAEDLVKLLEVSPGQRVLDVGTGTGVAARAAARAGGGEGVTVGIDPSIGMLRVAAREGGGPTYAAASSIDLPFRDATFDRLMANFVIAFFPNYQTALFELLRVLKPGGRLAVSWWGAGDNQDELRKTWLGVAEEFAEHEVLMDAFRRAVPWEERFSDRDVLKVTLHEAGLRDIWTELRDYRFQMSREDWLLGREVTPMGRFLRQMLGPELFETFRARSRQVFAQRFPDQLNDLRDVVFAVGHKP